jgi:hypothetical protein
MKPPNGQIAAPRFVTRNKRERDALSAWTMARLHQLDEHAQEGRLYYLLLEPVVHARREYAVAKSSARFGNLQPLRAFLVTIMGDAEIAEFIAEPRRPRGRRRSHGTLKQGISREIKHSAVVTVKSGKDNTASGSGAITWPRKSPRSGGGYARTTLKKP